MPARALSKNHIHCLPKALSGLEPFGSKPGRCRCGSESIKTSDPSALSSLSATFKDCFSCHTETKRRASTTLPRTSPKTDAGKHQRLHFYSSAAPRAELLNHLVIYQAPRNHPGSSAPSRIRNSLLLKNQRSTRTPSAIGHVARRCYPPGHPRMSKPSGQA